MDGTFFSCNSLRSITIPNSVVVIVGNPFQNWTGTLHNESKAFIYEDDVLFNKDKTTIIAYKSKESEYVIPDGVTNIGISAFSCCKFIRSIEIPNSVTSIGFASFSGCSSLYSITIPNSVTSIGDFAFDNCI